MPRDVDQACEGFLKSLPLLHKQGELPDGVVFGFNENPQSFPNRPSVKQRPSFTRNLCGNVAETLAHKGAGLR
ncbi:hypothetical protein BjapCC829_48630 (plasmid) [Bradyrhizobium barranii]|uniref:Uncharacterized protein n=1 Tax=Bradyrhizobium barranii TaxID=2992140 RepID=A0ABY3R297_9BRAD|nr:hypothetical protein [Bradyrhizobium japonicum]UFW92120.1 hypothetical protein BjapCC829_48630 [Bradyrhizobium japonicum]